MSFSTMLVLVALFILLEAIVDLGCEIFLITKERQGLLEKVAHQEKKDEEDHVKHKD